MGTTAVAGTTQQSDSTGTAGGEQKPVDQQGEQKPADQQGTQSGSTSPAGGTQEQPASAKPPVPEKYDLKLPEKPTLASAVLDRTATLARELGLSNEHAQKLVDFTNTEAATILESLLTEHTPGSGSAWLKQVEGWESEALKAPDLGNNNADTLKRQTELAKRVAATFFPEPVLKFLGDSGYSSHPDVIRGLIAIGKAMGEDKIVIPAQSFGQKDEPWTSERIGNALFPTTATKKE